MHIDNLKSVITFDDVEIQIEDISKLFGAEKYQMRDSNSKKVVGIISNVAAATTFFDSQIPYRLDANLTINGLQYSFENISSPKMIFPFKRNRFKFYEFLLKQANKSDYVKYSLTMRLPFWTTAGFYRQHAFEGSINSTTPDRIIIFLGMFLIQKSFTARFESIE